MNAPLGKKIGNACEISETLSLLTDYQETRLMQLAIQLSSFALQVQSKITKQEAKTLILNSLTQGHALRCFQRFIANQNGDLETFSQIISDPKIVKITVKSVEEGYLVYRKLNLFGKALIELGAGRKTKDDRIDYLAGIICHFEVGDFVPKNQPLFTITTNENGDKIPQVITLLNQTYSLSKHQLKKRKLIQKILKN
jgi:pyrimidine-nucleoside phosphorylase